MKKPTIVQFLILIISGCFVFVFYQYSQNGRYVEFGEGSMILDSRTGNLFEVYDAHDDIILKPIKK